ncbi:MULTISPECIES: hypothetical protein [Vibrio]|uniref:Uncharacterized protein n=1 Tax=Vibrio coralliilyticus TaxID=190893 RepID=A0AAP6ZIQ6_9VIBR|nr:MULTISPECIES: hypothetical protein [Vibrio]MDE3899226.1 hypothetical protein [Vibrio sp. CC007]NOH52965.1 hypothetical protein [Vibrio coralliilyticus]NOJ22306.1 hypothetical protein [Vibrio coralliilyticus]
MVINGYFELNKDTYENLPIKEHLGHKLISVEPDLLIDLLASFPRIMIRSELASVFSEIESLLIEAAYIDSSENKSYLSFLSTSRENLSLDIIDENNESLPIIFYHQNSLYIKNDIVSEINNSKSILDIEYRV